MSNYKPRAYSVSDFFSWYERGELELQPKFQRRDVWSNNAKLHLIDTIIQGIPTPLIFVRQITDPKRLTSVMEVVDGQQRLHAIFSFINNNLIMSESVNKSYAGDTFSSLSRNVQIAFMQYELSVILLPDVSDQDVLSIFARINSYSRALNPQEKLNAEFFGTFKQAVYQIGLQHLEFWRNNKILEDRAIMRMAEAELVTELLTAILKGIPERKDRWAVAKVLYRDYDNSFPDSEMVRKHFSDIISIINDIFKSDLSSTIFKGKVLFSSLFLALYHLRYGMMKAPNDIEKNHSLITFKKSNITAIRNALLTISNEYQMKETPQRIIQFKDASQKATANKDRTLIRIKYIVKVIRAACS